MPHYYIVESGLDEDDKIIYEGVQNIKDGMTVKPQFIAMKDISKELTFANQPK